jgi:hypothetical protein
VFTDPLSGNGCFIVAHFCFRWNVFTESLLSNGYTRHNIVFRSTAVRWFPNSEQLPEGGQVRTKHVAIGVILALFKLKKF